MTDQIKTNTDRRPAKAAALPVYEPVTDIFRTEEGLVLRTDVPGVDQASVQVDLEGGLLTIRGRVEMGLAEGARMLHRESGAREYKRSFRLGNQVAQEHITARLEHGVLELKLPFKAEVQPRKIDIQGS